MAAIKIPDLTTYRRRRGRGEVIVLLEELRAWAWKGSRINSDPLVAETFQFIAEFLENSDDDKWEKI